MRDIHGKRYDEELDKIVRIPIDQIFKDDDELDREKVSDSCFNCG